MKYTRSIVLVTTFLTSVLLADYHTSHYFVEDSYDIQFSTGSAEGTFSGLTGVVEFDSEDLASAKIDVSVDVNTIKTGNTKKDDHAIGKKWFDAATYPTMTYLASSISVKEDHFVANGSLTIKDVTLDQDITFTFDGQADQYLKGSFTINRKHFNINGNLFGFAVGKNIVVDLQVPAQFQR